MCVYVVALAEVCLECVLVLCNGGNSTKKFIIIITIIVIIYLFVSQTLMCMCFLFVYFLFCTPAEEEVNK